MKSMMLPLPNHGIATAATGSSDDVSDQMAHIFGWLSVDHLCSASASIYVVMRRVCIDTKSADEKGVPTKRCA